MQVEKNFVFFCKKGKLHIWNISQNHKHPLLSNKVQFRNNDDLIFAKNCEYSFSDEFKLQRNIIDEICEILIQLEEHFETEDNKLNCKIIYFTGLITAHDSQSNSESTIQETKTKTISKKPKPINMKELLNDLITMEFLVCLFNSFTKNLAKHVDRSLFRTVISLSNNSNLKTKRLSGDSKAKDKVIIKFIRFQSEFVNEILKPINARIEDLETRIEADFPDLPEILALEKKNRSRSKCKNKKKSRQIDFNIDYLSKLFCFKETSTWRIEGKIKQNNVAKFKFCYCSDYLFLLTNDNSLIVFDVFEGCKLWTLSKFSGQINDFVLRRNLNVYSSEYMIPAMLNEMSMLIQRVIKGNSSVVSAVDFLKSYISISYELREVFEDFFLKTVLANWQIVDEHALALQFQKLGRVKLFLLSAKRGFDADSLDNFLPAPAIQSKELICQIRGILRLEFNRKTGDSSTAFLT